MAKQLPLIQNFDPSRIRTPIALLAVALIVAQGVIGILVYSSDSSSERIFYSVIFLLSLVAFFVTFSLHFRVVPKLEPTTYNDSTEAVDILCKYIKSNELKEILLVEYSSQFIRPVINTALERNLDITLFVQHPESAPNDEIAGKTRMLLQQLGTEMFDSKSTLRVYMYKDTGALSARVIEGHLVMTGWYTHDRRPEVDGPMVHGHINPGIICRPSDSHYLRFTQFVQRVVSAYKKNAEFLDRDGLKKLSEWPNQTPNPGGNGGSALG